MKTIIKLIKTSIAAPEQYEGYLDSGERVYLRCRDGTSEVRIGTEEDWEKWTLKTVAKIQGGKTETLFGPGVLADLFRLANLKCDVDIDSLETTYYPPTGITINGMVIYTLDKDVIMGKDDRFRNIKEDDLAEISPELIDALREKYKHEK